MIWGVIKTALIAMVPIIELRGAIFFGAFTYNLPLWLAATASIVGNLIPVPLIILFARAILDFMKRSWKPIAKAANRLETRALGKSEKLYKGVVLGLLVFVAIPLPGTGAWTGALIAAVLKIRMKVALPAIAAGVIIAGIIMSTLIQVGVWTVTTINS
ncbi:MAG: small multi-drug export protein [Oscillospiraceae bacterium]|jgi:uncharacterized membrane protein|nr:small multi-drug export protein [Oscillospiraceae bacterium]